MHDDSALVAFVPTRDPARARQFYEHALGLKFVSEDPFAVVFDANGATLRVTNVANVPNYQPQPFTVLGWHVADVKSKIRELVAAGVEFERFPGLAQDELGIWRAPDGAQVAWFKDRDGNILSLTQA